MDDEELLVDEDYPTDGALLRLPEERLLADNEERAMVTGAIPLLNDIIAWFDDKIAWADSIGSLNTESSTPVESQIIARQILREMLISKRIEITNLRDTHTKL